MIARLFIYFIKLYQYTVSPLLGNRCRFYPSCSCYAVQCLEKYHLLHAIVKIIGRLLRCHPFNAGGVDIP